MNQDEKALQTAQDGAGIDLASLREGALQAAHRDAGRVQRPHGFLEQGMFDSVCRRLPEDVQAVVQFAYITSWRKSEALALTWDRVNFEDGIVELEKGTTKNGNARKLAFAEHPELAALLDDQRRSATSSAPRAVSCLPCSKPIRNRGLSWPPAVRHAPIVRAEPRAGRRVGEHGDARVGPQDPRHLRPPRHSERSRPPRCVSKARRDKTGTIDRICGELSP